MSRRRFSIAWVLLLYSWTGGSGSAQSSEGVRAQLSTGVARLGSEVVLSIVIEDAKKARIVSLPTIEGLSFGETAGPSTDSGLTIVNGRRSAWSNLVFRVRILPEREGDFVLPPIELETDRGALATRELALKVVRDVQGADLGYLEIRPSATRVIEGQPFTLEIRFGWDAESAFDFAELRLPWWDELSGVIELEPGREPKGADPVGKARVNGSVAVEVFADGTREREGRSFRSLVIQKAYLPSRPGSLDFGESFLEFGQEEPRGFGFFQERARRRDSYFVSAPAFTVDVIALPTEGQPFDFGGAVGAFITRARVDTRDVTVGDSLKFTVEWTGAGNLQFFDAPDLARLEAFRGFRVFGKTEEKSFERRVVTYDIAPLSTQVAEVPALALPLFDPATRRYGTVSTDPISIRVRPLEGARELSGGEESGFAPDFRDVRVALLQSTGPERAPSDRFLVLALFGATTLWLGGRFVVRRRGDPASPLARRRRRARAELVRALARTRDARGRLDAWTEFLAARAGEPRARREGRGLSGFALSEDAERTLERVNAALETCAWNGGAEIPGDAEISAAADLLLREQ